MVATGLSDANASGAGCNYAMASGDNFISCGLDVFDNSATFTLANVRIYRISDRVVELRHLPRLSCGRLVVAGQYGRSGIGSISATTWPCTLTCARAA